MIIPDLKKAMTTVVARRSPSGEAISGPAPMKTEIMKNSEGEMDDRHSAAQDVIAAMHEKSPEKMVQALANFMDMHSLRKKDSLDE